jgi:hypothetical protein
MVLGLDMFFWLFFRKKAVNGWWSLGCGGNFVEGAYPKG